MQTSPYIINQSAFLVSETLDAGYILRDGTNTPEAREQYFNDLYHLFLNKFARISHDTAPTEYEESRLQELLAETIAAKRRMEQQQ